MLPSRYLGVSNPGAQDGFSARALTARPRCVGAARGATAVVNVRAAANIVVRSRRGVRARANQIRSRVGCSICLCMRVGARSRSFLAPNVRIVYEAFSPNDVNADAYAQSVRWTFSSAHRADAGVRDAARAPWRSAPARSDASRSPWRPRATARARAVETRGDATATSDYRRTTDARPRARERATTARAAEIDASTAPGSRASARCACARGSRWEGEERARRGGARAARRGGSRRRRTRDARRRGRR